MGDSEENVAVGSDVEQEVLEDEPKSILLGIIGQLRKGMDLSRVTLPTFVLEPRSMCERITDFMSHPELILNTPQKIDPTDRFLDVVTYFLSGWHIKPKGVKKPYNPVLGEIFRCRWKFDDDSESFYVCEQVSHHPPISAYFYANPQRDVWILGDIRPKSKFLGNSAATIMQGTSTITFPKRWPGEEYIVTLPNMYARGILFGTMYIELGDTVTIKCPKNDLIAEIEFQTKGFFTGTYNGIKGKVKRESSGEVLYTLGGKWTDVMYLSKGTTSDKIPIFDAHSAKIYPKVVAPEAEQEEFESRRLWSKVTKGLLTKNLDYATTEKSAIEDNQRTIVKDRATKNIAWEPRFFRRNGDMWEFRSSDLPTDPLEANKALEGTIFGSATNPVHAGFWVRPDQINGVQ
ncbi:hypothetical protein SpCBS45565_g08191 [Spizellomyces sp. 'palustris']|nr:hypothetical protein SpCBS45565_g08191 [Spizellomyces sp. 'palustris']